jgi:hypothetical protein
LTKRVPPRTLGKDVATAHKQAAASPERQASQAFCQVKPNPSHFLPSQCKESFGHFDCYQRLASPAAPIRFSPNFLRLPPNRDDRNASPTFPRRAAAEIFERHPIMNFTKSEIAVCVRTRRRVAKPLDFARASLQAFFNCDRRWSMASARCGTEMAKGLLENIALRCGAEAAGGEEIMTAATTISG